MLFLVSEVTLNRGSSYWSCHQLYEDAQQQSVYSHNLSVDSSRLDYGMCKQWRPWSNCVDEPPLFMPLFYVAMQSNILFIPRQLSIIYWYTGLTWCNRLIYFENRKITASLLMQIVDSFSQKILRCYCHTHNSQNDNMSHVLGKRAYPKSAQKHSYRKWETSWPFQ